MKFLTPFQEALLTSAESQFAEVPEEAQIDIQPSQSFYDRIPGKKKFIKPLRKACLVAAALALLVGGAFAVRFFSLGQPEVYKFPFPAEVEACDVYVIKFQEEFANEDAPDTIETFYLPTLDVSVETANPGWSSVSDEEKSFHPLMDSSEFDASAYDWYTEQFPESPTHFSAGWTVEGKQITFWQKTAKHVPIGTDFYSIAFIPEAFAENQTEILQIDHHEVLSLLIHWNGAFSQARHTTHYWFWTDGEYVFQLSADDADLDYMQQLMESIEPIEDSSPYLGKD